MLEHAQPRVRQPGGLGQRPERPRERQTEVAGQGGQPPERRGLGQAGDGPEGPDHLGQPRQRCFAGAVPVRHLGQYLFREGVQWPVSRAHAGAQAGPQARIGCDGIGCDGRRAGQVGPDRDRAGRAGDVQPAGSGWRDGGQLEGHRPPAIGRQGGVGGLVPRTLVIHGGEMTGGQDQRGPASRATGPGTRRGQVRGRGAHRGRGEHRPVRGQDQGEQGCLPLGPAGPQRQPRPERDCPHRPRRQWRGRVPRPRGRTRSPPPRARGLVQPAGGELAAQRQCVGQAVEHGPGRGFTDRARHHQRAGHLAHPAYGCLGQGLRETAVAGGCGRTRRPARSVRHRTGSTARPAGVRRAAETAVRAASHGDASHGDASSGPESRAADLMGGAAGRAAGGKDGPPSAPPGAAPASRATGTAGKPVRGAARTRPSAAGGSRPAPPPSSCHLRPVPGRAALRPVGPAARPGPAADRAIRQLTDISRSPGSASRGVQASGKVAVTWLDRPVRMMSRDVAAGSNGGENSRWNVPATMS